MKQITCSLLAVLGAVSVVGTRAEAPVPLRVDPIIFKINLDPQFEFRDNILTLKEYNDSGAGPHRIRVLWTGPLGAQLQRFILETTESAATLRDAGDHILWVEHYTVPSLTLDFSKTGQATLTNQSGQTLWTGPWDGKRTPRSAAQGRAECNGFVFLTPKEEVARLEDTHGTILWTGSEPSLGGLYIIDYGQRSPLAWHSIPFPVNEKFAYDIADVPENVTLEDKNHAALGTQTVPTIQITKRSSQGYYATHPIVTQITPSVMPRPLAVGTYSVTFRDKDSNLVQSQTLDIDSVRAVELAGGRTLETAHFHGVTRDAKGQVTDDNTSTTSSELPAASGGNSWDAH